MVDYLVWLTNRVQKFSALKVDARTSNPPHARIEGMQNDVNHKLGVQGLTCFNLFHADVF